MVKLIIGTAAAFLITASGLGAAEWLYPVIRDAGPVVSLPDAAVQPVAGMDYKIVFDITGWPKMKGKPVPGLSDVARVINLFAAAGGDRSKLDLVLVLHGDATESALQPAAFKARHKFANPNLKLIDALKQRGVTLYVCGQALAEHHIAHDNVNPAINIALSALVVLPTYQLRGYALMPPH